MLLLGSVVEHGQWGVMVRVAEVERVSLKACAAGGMNVSDPRYTEPVVASVNLTVPLNGPFEWSL